MVYLTLYNWLLSIIESNRVLGAVSQTTNQAAILHKGYIDICVMSVAVNIL